MRIILTTTALALLAACGTPQEQCIREGTRDLRVLNGLITQTQGNLNRGYGLEEYEDIEVVRRTCEGETEDGAQFEYRCDTTETVTRTRPIAIDLNAERAKLESLLQQRERAAAQAQATAEQCRAIYPE